MTHASGITGTDKLVEDLIKIKSEDARCVQIKIENESLYMSGMDYAEKSFKEDYDRCLCKYLSDTECCYLMYRTDEKTNLGFNWIFMHWVPDNASVREKMLYASTRATMKKIFGEAYFVEDLTGYEKDDLLHIGYEKHQESKNAPPPLTQSEMDLIEIKKAEKATALDDGHRTLKSMGFPPTDSLSKLISAFANENFDFLEMSIDISNEKICDECRETSMTCDELRNRIDIEHARYFLFRFKHQFENQSYQPILFIYSMPGYSASVKQRMLYSSCKAPFIDLLQNQYNINIERRMELFAGDLSDLVTENLLIDLHPPKIDNRPSFSKPKGPNNRGPKRLIKG